MNISLLRRVAAMLAVLTVAFAMTACYQPPTAIITDPQTTPTTNEPTRATIPSKTGQLTLSLLLGTMRSDMKWSQISTYTHTSVDDTHATFAVADNYGKECTLSVTFDAAADTISEATLSYKDTAISVLTDNTLVIRTIMLAMNEE